jgi:broad specificity phosphatase PhoE
MTILHLVRHGHTGLGAARIDGLSELGFRQSRLLGAWWARLGLRPGLVAVGTFTRHRQSADACLAELGGWFPVTTEPGLDDFDGEDLLRVHNPALTDPEAIVRYFASHENPHRAFQRLFAEAVGRWVGGAHDDAYLEPWPAFRSRCLEALESLAATTAAQGHEALAIFTSGGPIAVACQAALGIPDDRLLRLIGSLGNAGVTRLGTGPSGGFRLMQFNAVPHLEAERDSTLLTSR